MCCPSAVGVTADGQREVLGLDVVSGEDGAGWLAFLRSLVARGLSGVALVISDAHAGLVEAIGATLGGAAWQRCRTHYAANLMSLTPKSSWGWGQGVTALHLRPDADILAFTAFPKEIWRQTWSNNPNERLNRVIR